jgi:hypothetical protein
MSGISPKIVQTALETGVVLGQSVARQAHEAIPCRLVGLVIRLIRRSRVGCGFGDQDLPVLVLVVRVAPVALQGNRPVSPTT